MAHRGCFSSAPRDLVQTHYLFRVFRNSLCAPVSPLCAPVIMLFTTCQIAPNFQSTKVINIADTPFTNVTPPNEISADRSGMRVSEVHNQK